MTAQYVLLSRWRVRRGRESLWDALDALLASDDPMVWWPAVRVVEHVDDRLTLRASSRLGYVLTFTLTDLVTSRPEKLSFDASGDLRGRGVLTFVETAAESTTIEIDWRVHTDRAWMRRTSWLLKPVFVLGHALVMRQGERRLSRWLDEKAV